MTKPLIGAQATTVPKTLFVFHSDKSPYNINITQICDCLSNILTYNIQLHHRGEGGGDVVVGGLADKQAVQVLPTYSCKIQIILNFVGKSERKLRYFI